jgi:hypothetical protein
VIIAAFLMLKFRWPIGKALDYFGQRFPGVKLKPTYLNALLALEKRLRKKKAISSNSGWEYQVADKEE